MFIIAKKGLRGRLVMAENPAVHPTIELAQEEATRLATSTPEVEYLIFEGVNSTIAKAEYKVNQTNFKEIK